MHRRGDALGKASSYGHGWFHRQWDLNADGLGRIKDSRCDLEKGIPKLSN